MKSILRYSRISPKKANLIAGMVRKRDVKNALDILKFTSKKGAQILFKVVASAAANAKNNFKQKEDHLFIEEIVITKGPTLKRHIPVSRGRAHPIRKMTSHITVKLGVHVNEAKAKAKAAGKKTEETAEVKETKDTEVKTTKAKKPTVKKVTTKKVKSTNK